MLTDSKLCPLMHVTVTCQSPLLAARMTVQYFNPAWQIVSPAVQQTEAQFLIHEFTLQALSHKSQKKVPISLGMSVLP
jgi:hypothetical protein